MADAIVVGTNDNASEPAPAVNVVVEAPRKQRPVKVAPASPELDPETGIVTVGEYTSKVREGLGSAEDFNGEPLAMTPQELTLESGVKRFIRTDH